MVEMNNLDTHTKAQAQEIVDQTVETIADIWPRGMPYRADVAAKFDARILNGIRARNIYQIKRDCAAYQTWIARQVAKWRLG